MHMAHIVREMRGVAPTANGFFFFTRNLFFLHLFLTGYLIHHIGSGDSRAPEAESLRLLTPCPPPPHSVSRSGERRPESIYMAKVNLEKMKEPQPVMSSSGASWY
jgi:hypothetical protein